MILIIENLINYMIDDILMKKFKIKMISNLLKLNN